MPCAACQRNCSDYDGNGREGMAPDDFLSVFACFQVWARRSADPGSFYGTHDTSQHSQVTDIESAAVYNEEKGEVTIFAVNRNTENDIDFEADIRGFEGYQVKEYIVMESDDMKLANSAAASPVAPKTRTDYTMENGIFKTVMKKCSWNVIVFSK